MAVDIKRKPNESVESLVRRFSQRMMQSRVLQLARSKKFHTKKATKRQVKNSAKVRSFNRARRDYLQKIGKLPETTSRFGPKNYTQKLVMGGKKKK
jgi:ribosomal protein S21